MSVTNPDASYVTNLETLVAQRTEQVRHAMSEMQTTQDVAIEALGNALAMKHAESLQHLKRVAACSIVLARELGFRPDRIRTIARAAFLHDIGKLGVPEALLHKRTALSTDEITIMQNHCDLGYKLIRRMPFLLEESELIQAHHERWDGKGYPLGSRGETIPVGARVIAVVNAFDCISSDQPYRLARPMEVAVQELADGSGSQFDPSIVAAFMKVPQSTWLQVREEVASYEDWIGP